MRTENKLAVFFTGISILLLVISFIQVKKYDKIPPVIEFSGKGAVYTDSVDTEELLKGVRATDDVDGDITDRIVIEKVTKTASGRSVIVTYAVGDEKNNFVKASRMLFCESDKKTAAFGENTEVGTVLEVPVESKEEADTVTEKQEITPNYANEVQMEIDERVPVLTLKDAEIELKRGKYFNVNDYIEELKDDVDDISVLQKRIRTAGEFNNQVPGDYEVTICVSDSEGNLSKEQPLLIHVVE